MLTTALTTTEPPAPTREPDCTDPAHRRRALARARRCYTCRKDPPDGGGYGGYGSPADGIRQCLGCDRLIGYYSCAPGYCVACAHDPCWVPVR